MFGDNNVQNIQIQVAVLREIVSRIDTSTASPADKEVAKGFLEKFLTHPVTAAVMSGISNAVFAQK